MWGNLRKKLVKPWASQFFMPVFYEHHESFMIEMIMTSVKDTVALFVFELEVE